ncbi:MAG: DUF2207 domain-containing protein, partial [Nitrospirae bacterium]|nr:DUF2207 domain-containing protein [Nitrospirota bacterium]
MHTDITVNEDSTLTITETINIRSGNDWFRNSFNRDLPTARRILFGLRHSKGFEIIECLRDGRPEKYEIYGFKGLLVRVGDLMDSSTPPTERTYILKYRLDGQISSNADHDKLTWTVTDRYWGWWPVDVTASVRLPDGASAYLKKARGVIRARDPQPEVESDASTDKAGLIHFSSPRALDQEESFSVSLSWPKG